MTISVPSASRPGTTHAVRDVGTAYVSCDCAGFYYRRTCRHLAEAEALAFAARRAAPTVRRLPRRADFE